MSASTVTLARISTKSGAVKPFVAGILLLGRRVEMTAPLLAFMRGWDAQKVKDYVDGHNWTIERVTSKPIPQPGDPLPKRPDWAPPRNPDRPGPHIGPLPE